MARWRRNAVVVVVVVVVVAAAASMHPMAPCGSDGSGSDGSGIPAPWTVEERVWPHGTKPEALAVLQHPVVLRSFAKGWPAVVRWQQDAALAAPSAAAFLNVHEQTGYVRPTLTMADPKREEDPRGGGLNRTLCSWSRNPVFRHHDASAALCDILGAKPGYNVTAAASALEVKQRAVDPHQPFYFLSPAHTLRPCRSWHRRFTTLRPGHGTATGAAAWRPSPKRSSATCRPWSRSK
jgi:hypothetical protein